MFFTTMIETMSVFDLVPFVRYSASNNGVTLKSCIKSFKVAEYMEPFDRSYATYY